MANDAPVRERESNKPVIPDSKSVKEGVLYGEVSTWLAKDF